MVSRRSLKLALLSLTPILSMTALMALSQTPPQPAPKKTDPFPLSLFQQAAPDDYIDESACQGCHATPHASFQGSPHMPYMTDPKAPADKRGCQGCHGPGGPHIANLEKPEEIRKHIVSFTKTTAQESSTACLRCHNDTMTMAHWRRTGHARGDVRCVSCHYIHSNPEEQKEQAQAEATKKKLKVPFFIAQKDSTKLLRGNEVTLCASCHMKEAAEFRHTFHHPIPEGRMLCSDCHEIHPRRESEKFRSATTRMRSSDQRLMGELKNGSEMCRQCHAETAGPFVFEHDPVAGHSSEGCMECHRPHGSHNPRLLTTYSRGLCNQCHTDKANNHFPGRTCWMAGCHTAVHGSNRDLLLFRR